MAYEPGKSGNPKGRPKKTMEQILFEHRCREYLEKFGFEDIVSMAKSAAKADKKWALEVMLDRGFGRPVQAIDADINQSAAGSSPIELIGEIAAIIPQAVGAGEGKDSAGGPPVEPGAVPVVQPEQGAGQIH